MLLNVCMSVQMTKRRHVHVCPMMTRTGPDGPVNRSEPGLLWQTDSCLLLSLEGVWFLTQSPHKPTHPHQSSFICCPRSLLPYHLSHDAPSPLSTATTPTCLLFLNEVHLFNLPDPPAWLWLHLDCENEQRQLQKECELRAHSSHYVAKALPACLMKGNNGASPWDTPLNLTPPHTLVFLTVWLTVTHKEAHKHTPPDGSLVCSCTWQNAIPFMSFHTLASPPGKCLLERTAFLLQHDAPKRRHGFLKPVLNQKKSHSF